MFVLSPVAGRLAGKHGPRWFMTFGPLIAAVGFLLMLRMRAHTAYFTEMLPGVLVFGVGLSAHGVAADRGDPGRHRSAPRRHRLRDQQRDRARRRPARDRRHRRDPGGAVSPPPLDAADVEALGAARAGVPRRGRRTARSTPPCPTDVGGRRARWSRPGSKTRRSSALHAGLLGDGRAARRRAA